MLFRFLVGSAGRSFQLTPVDASTLFIRRSSAEALRWTRFWDAPIGAGRAGLFAARCAVWRPDHSYPFSAAILSLFLREAADALIILAIVMVSGLLSFWSGMAGDERREETTRTRSNKSYGSS